MIRGKMLEKIRFPDRREVDIQEVVTFLYGLSKSDAELLLETIIRKGRVTTRELASTLKVTRVSINKSINNLLYKGLIYREKAKDEKKKGRPEYVYWVDSEALYKKIAEDLQKLITNVQEGLKNHSL